MNTPRHMLNVLRLAVALLFASALMSRCASMMTPTGGPRDSLPPVIVNMTPDNFATGRPTVGHGKIYIEFDEFVQLKDQQKEFFTSPQMTIVPPAVILLYALPSVFSGAAALVPSFASAPLVLLT